MPGDVIHNASRTAARAVLRRFEELGARPPANAEVRIEFNHPTAQVYLTLTAEDNGGNRHHFSGVLQGTPYYECTTADLQQMRQITQEIWHHEREEYLVRTNPAVIAARERINQAVVAQEPTGALHRAHDAIEQYVRHGIAQNAEYHRRSAEAAKKGMALLKRHLNPEQLRMFEAKGHFRVRGGDTGRVYQIETGTHLNVYLLGDEEESRPASVRHWLFGTTPIPSPRKPKLKKRCGYCFMPAGGLCAGDVMLVQKLSLEIDETAALKKANRFPVY
jgi:hypothetical protein